MRTILPLLLLALVASAGDKPSVDGKNALVRGYFFSGTVVS